MYAALWKVLPGPAWLRIIMLVILLAAVVYCLFTWVYPWISDTFVSGDPSIEN